MSDNIIYADDILRANGDDYKASDNRTHRDQILDYDPKIDMRYRKTIVGHGTEGLGLSAKKTLIGYIYAENYDEANRESFTPVLYFPKATEIGMIKIKNQQFHSVYPQSLIERFKMNDPDLSNLDLIITRHSMPIFFNPSDERFYIFFDVRVINDLHVNSIKSILNNDTNKDLKSSFKIISSKKANNTHYLSASFKTMDELRETMEDRNGFYHIFLENYKNLFLDFNKGKDVILIQYQKNNSDDPINESTKIRGVFGGFKPTPMIKTIQPAAGFNDSFMHTNFVRAVMIGNNAYFYDDNGDINKHNSIYINPKRISLTNYLNYLTLNENLSLDDKINISNTLFNIIDYSEDSWQKLLLIRERLDQIMNTLNDLFISTKTEDGLLDKPIDDANTLELPFLNK